MGKEAGVSRGTKGEAANAAEYISRKATKESKDAEKKRPHQRADNPGLLQVLGRSEKSLAGPTALLHDG